MDSNLETVSETIYAWKGFLRDLLDLEDTAKSAPTPREVSAHKPTTNICASESRKQIVIEQQGCGYDECESGVTQIDLLVKRHHKDTSKMYGKICEEKEDY